MLNRVFLAVWALMLLLGCAQTYKLQDSQGQVLTVTRPSFAPSSRVVFRIGDAERPVNASEIVSLTIRGDEPYSRDGKVYYTATLLLEDSVKVPDEESKALGRAVYIDADGWLEAKHAGGRLRVPLAEVRALYRYEVPEPKDSASAPKS